MKLIDRIILLVLAAGVWALVIQPRNLEAHDSDYHSCKGSGTGYGEPDGDEIYVYQLDLDISCEHY